MDFYKPKVILISGTLGKTTTKDNVSSVLSQSFSVCKTFDNSNNEFGVAYTILGINPADGYFLSLVKLVSTLLGISKNYPEILVIEIGTRKVGDIKASTHYIKADIVIVTKIAKIPSHIEYFKNLDEQASEEFAVVNCLKNNGKLICFEEDVKYFNSKVRPSIICISNNSNSKFNRLLNCEFKYEQSKLIGCNFTLSISDKVQEILYRGCASQVYAFSVLFALSAYEILVNINLLKVTNGRSKILSGVSGSTIIDDSYNAGPDSVLMALDNLGKIKCGGKKIAVLGEMFELGEHSKGAHSDVLERAISVSDEVYLIGKAFVGSFHSKIRGVFNSPREIGDLLYKNMSNGDTALIKGSQSNRLEIATQLISSSQKNVVQNLVRQTPFWREKNSVVFSMDYIPFYDQNTLEDWSNKGFSSYEEANLWNKKACGIACMKMVVESFGKENISLGNLIREAVSYGTYKPGIGWIHLKLAQMIRGKFKLSAEAERGVPICSIKKVIEEGGLVIASVGFNFESKKAGHLVVVLGYEIKNGQVSGFYVHHPSSRNNKCMAREYVPIKSFIITFSGNIIKIKK